MIKIVAIVVVVLITAVLIFAATKPDTFTVIRSTTIKAPPEKIFAKINNFNGWVAWSPWEKKDPGMKRTFGATTSGKGATYAWDGNQEVGQGSMEITESVPSSKVALKLDFLKPFEAHNQVDFTLEAKGDSTSVTWRMQGPLPYMMKVVHVFMNMDKMVGKDFEAGLANLKASSEK